MGRKRKTGTHQAKPVSRRKGAVPVFVIQSVEVIAAWMHMGEKESSLDRGDPHIPADIAQPVGIVLEVSYCPIRNIMLYFF